MFDRVRNQFVWTIMLIISMILTVAFVAIYTSASISLTRQIDSQAQIRSQGLTAGDNIISFFQRQREEYARRALGELSATLLLSGVATMAEVVHLLSRYIANRAIAPIEEAYNNSGSSWRMLVTNLRRRLRLLALMLMRRLPIVKSRQSG